MDMPQPEVEQGIYHITAIMEHGVIDGLLGETRGIGFAHSKYERGHPSYFLLSDIRSRRWLIYKEFPR